jgi:hypothetical protein
MYERFLRIDDINQCGNPLVLLTLIAHSREIRSPEH